MTRASSRPHMQRSALGYLIAGLMMLPTARPPAAFILQQLCHSTLDNHMVACFCRVCGVFHVARYNSIYSACTTIIVLGSSANNNWSTSSEVLAGKFRGSTRAPYTLMYTMVRISG